MAWHEVGRRDGRRLAHNGGAVPEDQPRDACSIGYFHGLIGGFTDRFDGKGEASETKAATTCGGIRSRRLSRECAHAAGHVFARAEPAARTILKRCKGFSSMLESDAQPWLSECYYGSLMERTLPLDNPSPTDCRSEPADVVRVCYRYLPSRLAVAGVKARAAAHRCGGAPKRWRSDCIDGVFIQYGKSACQKLEAGWRRKRCAATSRAAKHNRPRIAS